MGAFENEIRENETFESLMDLYGETFGEIKCLTAEVADLKRELVEAREDTARIECLEENQDMVVGRGEFHRLVLVPHEEYDGMRIVGHGSTLREALDAALAARKGER